MLRCFGGPAILKSNLLFIFNFLLKITSLLPSTFYKLPKHSYYITHQNGETRLKTQKEIITLSLRYQK